MQKKGRLILDCGEEISCSAFGNGIRIGEIVFNTSMYGYEEIITDPSYKGEIIVLTYPLIDNLSFDSNNLQSKTIHANGIIISDIANSSIKTKDSFFSFLESNNISCLYDIDTRKLTRQIANGEIKKCAIVIDDFKINYQDIQTKIKDYNIGSDIFNDHINNEEKYLSGNLNNGIKIGIVDFGVKRGIIDRVSEYCEEIIIFNSSVPIQKQDDFLRDVQILIY